MSFEPGAVLEDTEWQTPAYCFTDDEDDHPETAKKSLISEPDGRDDGSFIPKIRMLTRG